VHADRAKSADKASSLYILELDEEITTLKTGPRKDRFYQAKCA